MATDRDLRASRGLAFARNDGNTSDVGADPMVAAAPTGEQFTVRRRASIATVVEVGGGLRTFDVDGHHVVAGFDVGEMAPFGRGQVLVPWPNRIADGRYAWDGATQQLPINEVDRSTAIHGLVRFGAWTCIGRTEDRLELAHTVWPTPGYPFTLEVRVAYLVEDRALTVTTTARNLGTEPAPFGAGQHPYLLPPSGLSGRMYAHPSR